MTITDSPSDIVRAFICALERADLDTALTYLATDCVYDNVPFGAVVGHDAVRAALGPFMAGFDRIEWVIHHQLESVSGALGIVLNERLDRFGSTAADGTVSWFELPIAGVFEVRDGIITLWRDYFDPAPLQRWMSARG